MKKPFLFLVLALGMLPFLTSCDSSSSSDSQGAASFVEDSLAVDFIRILAEGKEVTLGTNLTSANKKDRPEMVVVFNYDFSIGKHEVTCKEFNHLMDRLKLDCSDDSIPATGVSFYDAVLFANARSIAEKKDTAYSYTSATFDSKGNCTDLEGFAFHPDVDAYRLPTEAEWIAASQINWNPKKGWNSDNSDYKLHKVCTASESSDLCDMAGNAMEWVNDWFGDLRDTTIANYVGAPDGGSLGQRVVKGGSFRNAPDAIKQYSRGDVYTVTSATKADYVGFRLAYGKIPEAVWMSADGEVGDSRIVALANSSTVKSYTGTYATKLAFRNDVSGNLAYIDYAGGNVSVKEIKDSIDVYHPEISPDGKWVAFCTLPEGTSGKSKLYVRRLNQQGENLVKLDVESAAIPRWRVLESGDTAIVYVTSPANNKDEANFKKESTWQVSFKNGKFGKEEKLFDGAYHGGVSIDNNLAVSGSQLLRVRISKEDSVWFDSEQACNVSLDQDETKRTLFLDFGSKVGEEFVGEKYGAHEFILVVDSTGELVQGIPAPDGFTFDHSEWAVGNYTSNGLIVATLTNSDGAHAKIVLVDTKDSSIVELAEGDELWHPSLWMDSRNNQVENVFLNLDSAGVYLSEGSNSIQEQFRVKMERFWKHINTIEVLLMGSSRIEIGVMPDLFPERKMFNWGTIGIDVKRDLYFAENYGLNHVKNLKTVVFALDLDSWRGTDGGAEDHLGILFAGGPGYKYDADHQFWVDNLPENFVDAVSASYPASEWSMEMFSEYGGWKNAHEAASSVTTQVMRDSIYNEEEMAALNERLDDLEQFVDKAAQRNINVVGMLIPQAPGYKKTGSYGAYGLQKSVAKEKIEWLKSLSERKKNFILMDEYKMGDNDYDGLFYDQDHLGETGTAQITARLDSLLGTLE